MPLVWTAGISKFVVREVQASLWLKHTINGHLAIFTRSLNRSNTALADGRWSAVAVWTVILNFLGIGVF